MESTRASLDQSHSINEKQLWGNAVIWLQLRLREINKFYPLVETGKGKHIEHIVDIQNQFSTISKDITLDYNHQRGLLKLIHKEKGAQLGRKDNNTGLVIEFTEQEKALKDQLACDMEKEIFLQMLNTIETRYGKQQQKYCRGFMGMNQKDPASYTQYLNTKTKGHHFARMLGLTLKEIYQIFPELNKEKYPVMNLNSLNTYNFVTAIDSMGKSGNKKVAEPL